MNNSMVVFLINDEVRAVAGTYEVEDNAKREIFKTFDPDIGVGDYVVVESGTRHKMTVVKIVETGVTPDFESAAEVKWIIAPINKAAYARTLKQEAAAIEAVKQAELKRKKDDLRKSMMGTYASEIQALPIAKLNIDSVSEPETPLS